MPSPTQATRARAWIFTVNNYDGHYERKLKRIPAQYLIYGREVGANGTPHLQGYAYFANQRTRSQAAKLIPQAYLDIRQGSHEQARDYCIKDGNYHEQGDPPSSPLEGSKKGGEVTKAKWTNIVAKASSGDMGWIRDNQPKEYAIHKPRLESLYAPRNGPMDGDLLHEWWVGPTGSAKSKTLWDLYPDHFAKAINKWWDGYRHEDVVAIEEWSPDNTVTAQALKRWADRYPFTGEIKGGTMQRLRPRKIIVLSNYTLEQCFTRSEDLAPLKRRFKVIEFPGGALHAGYRAAWFKEPPSIPMETDDAESTAVSSEDMEMEEPDLTFLDNLFSQE